MAHFYSRIKGVRGEATRCGTKNSGITASAQGWDIGATVTVRHDAVTGEDIVHVCIHGGSNGRHSNLHVGDWTIRDGQIVGKS